MRIRDLEKDEICEIVNRITLRMSEEIVLRFALQARVEGLEKVLDAATRDARCKDAGQNEYVVKLLKAEKRIGDLEGANDSLATAGKKWMAEAEKLREDINSLRETNIQLGSDHLKAQEEWRASAELFRTNERRLERELREARATVMNEVSAMIPKAVEAERAACAEIGRQAALTYADSGNANAVMSVVNAINWRKKC